MKSDWDYTELARHYLKRPDYATDAIDRLCALATLRTGSRACDVGAGSAHLTKLLLDRGMEVVAVEPNDAMRAVGESVTAGRRVTWVVGSAEETRQPDSFFDLVSFGSSFNTTDRSRALRETARILRPGGWFACLWNHRDLSDPLQRRVEEIIQTLVPNYSYGTRREDQTETIRGSGLFHEPEYIEASYVATLEKVDYVEAWRSHATLAQQAGDRFKEVVDAIEAELGTGGMEIRVGYTTRLWAARKR